MTTEAFDKSITEEINRRVSIYARQDAIGCACVTCGQMTTYTERLLNGDLVPLCAGCRLPEQDIAPHIAKIPLRSELRDLLQAAEIYDEQAARHTGEAAKCAELARCAREQAQNLVKCANL